MALTDISFTSGMRANLVNLESSVSLLERTESRLASGKGQHGSGHPTHYFTAQSHLKREADLDPAKMDGRGDPGGEGCGCRH